jgi:hypothetical protein
MAAAAKTLKLELHEVEVKTSADLDVAFRRIKDDGALRTINHPENARTGTVAVRPTRQSRRMRPRLHRNAGQLAATASRSAPAAELLVIDLVAQHDVEADEQPPGKRHLRFGPATSTKNCKVDALEIGIASSRERSRLAEHPTQERAALLGDMPQPVLVRGGVDGCLTIAVACCSAPRAAGLESHSGERTAV